MKYAIIFALALFLFPRTVAAQNCYVRLTDASGYTPTSGQLDALEQAAAALCAVFDSAGFGGQFKVYDFGFYLHHETTTGGYPEPFARKIEEVAGLSPYYLVFGREANGQGTSQRFWVEAGLPDSGIFYCINQLSPALRDNLSKKYGIIANEIHRLGAERPENKFHLAEIGAMDSLRTYIFDLMDCCDGEQRAVSPSCNACVFTYSQISQNLLDAGFATTTPLTQFDTITSTGISASIDGRTNLILDIEGDSIELDKHASGIAERYMENNPGNTIKIFLRKFSDVCVNLEATLDQFRADNSDAKVLMAAIPDDGGNKIRLHFLSEGDLRVGVTYEGCTEQQDSILNNDIQYALKMLDTAYAKLNRYNGIAPPEVKNALILNFGGASHPIAAQNIKKSIMSLRTYGPWAGYDCVQVGDGLCGSTISAYAISCVPFFDIRICVPNYFNLGQIERSATLIHEWSHKYHCTDDRAYEWQPDYPKNSTFEQLWNADAYSELVKYLWQ